MQATQENCGALFKAMISLMVPALVCSFALTACSEKEQPAQNSSQGETVRAVSVPRGKIVIKGSNTVGEELAPRLIDEYKKDHTTAKFDLESKGTGTGFSGLVADTCDIAAASRPIDPGEQELAKSHGVEMSEHGIGSYSVAVVVNSGNSVSGLTKDQIRDIFTGTVTNWKDVGGADGAIHLYIRDPISGTYLGFQELAMDKKPYAANNATKFKSYGEIEQAVAQDGHGIGYTSIQLGAKQGVKAISVGGVEPTAATVNEGKYPYTRALHLYTNKARETADARAFVDFVISAKGQAILNEMGFVPHK
jgi:phosphate transport system substrate-binding protein